MEYVWQCRRKPCRPVRKEAPKAVPCTILEAVEAVEALESLEYLEALEAVGPGLEFSGGWRSAEV